jgi:hypothetical protein
MRVWGRHCIERIDVAAIAGVMMCEGHTFEEERVVRSRQASGDPALQLAPSRPKRSVPGVDRCELRAALMMVGMRPWRRA